MAAIAVNIAENIITENRKKLEKLAYLLGSFFGDGCFYRKDRGRIIFSSTDKEFIEVVAGNIRKLFNFNIKVNIRKDFLSRRNKNWKDSCRFSSRPLYKILKKFANLEIPEFIKESKENKAMFIRGFFDAEGNVDVHMIKKRNEIQRHLRCSNNNKYLLNKIKSFLREFQIKSCICKSKGNNYCLTIWGYISLLNFERHINFNILRKKILLRKAIESYKQIQNQWNDQVYKKVMMLRRRGLGSTNIKRCLIRFSLNIPKPTIEAWIYRKTRIGGVSRW